MLATLLSALDEVARLCPLVPPAHPGWPASCKAQGAPGGCASYPPPGISTSSRSRHRRAWCSPTQAARKRNHHSRGPVPTLRDNTERPITLTEGTNRLVGRDPDRIVTAARQVLAAPPPPRRPALWDGRAGHRIAVALLADAPGSAERLRPTDTLVDPAARLQVQASSDLGP